MSADPSQTALEALQCHFTWDLDCPPSVLSRLRDKLEDIGSEEGNRWRGHIYNLRGFIQHKLGLHEDAKSLFNKAAEAFHTMRHADQGPWLLVNYGNLAWLHHHLGDQEESQAFLSKVDALMEKYPSPFQDELPAEVCAEKAWTLMYFTGDLKVAAGLFERAVGMQPDMVEWNTSYVLSLVRAPEHIRPGVTPDLLERMRQAKELDPENLYLAVLYLEQQVKKGESTEKEVREFAKDNLETLSRSYHALRALLSVFKHICSVDEAIDLAEEALRKHPDQRYLKKFLALCFRWKIIPYYSPRPSQVTISRVISLQEEVVSLYSDSVLMMKTDLAMVYEKSKSAPHQAKAEHLFKELLQGSEDLEPADKQLLYNTYANCLYYDRGDPSGAIHFHMKAAEIPEDSYFRRSSIRVLKKNMSPAIEEFLKNLQEPV